MVQIPSNKQPIRKNENGFLKEENRVRAIQDYVIWRMAFSVSRVRIPNLALGRYLPNTQYQCGVALKNTINGETSPAPGQRLSPATASERDAVYTTLQIRQGLEHGHCLLDPAFWGGQAEPSKNTDRCAAENGRKYRDKYSRAAGPGPQGMRQSASLLRREPQQKAETHVCRQLMGEKCREAETGGVRLAAGRGWTPVWVGQEQEETEKRHVKDT